MERPDHAGRMIALIGAAGLWHSASTAAAANLTHPRTPVDWEGQPCAVVHDRSADGPVVHLDYGIPGEDLEGISDNEVADARRHQFFALCRQHAVRDLLPGWIDAADVAAAEAKGLPVGAAELLVEAPDWADCHWQITPDEERRPISYEAAAAGFDWDTTGLPPGVYAIEGYTWDPPFNLWTSRPGFVKIVDGTVDALDLPALGILGQDGVVEAGKPVTLRACSDISVDARLFIEATALVPGEEPSWITLGSDAPHPGPDGELEFIVPAQLAGQAITVRLRSEDGEGRATIAYLPAELSVIEGVDPEAPTPEAAAPGESGCAAGPGRRRPETGYLALWLSGLALTRRRLRRSGRSTARPAQETRIV